jgi:hypothetical protein
VPQGNLLPNNALTTLWRGGSYAGTTSTAALDRQVTYHGQPSIRISGRGDYYGERTSERFAVNDALTYTLSAQVKTERITRLVEMDVFWYNRQGKELRWTEAVGGRLKGTQDWTTLSGTVTPPRGAVSAVIQFRTLSHGGRAWFSEPSVEAQQPAAPVATTPAPTPAPSAPPAAWQALAQRIQSFEADYQTQQQQILATYQQALTTGDWLTMSAAYTTAKQAQDAAYQTAVTTWQRLYEEWQALMTAPTEEQ